MALGITFKSFICFEFDFVYGVSERPGFIVRVYRSSFPDTNYRGARLRLFCGALIDLISEALFLGSLLRSADLSVCFYARAVPFRFLQFRGTVRHWDR